MNRILFLLLAIVITGFVACGSDDGMTSQLPDESVAGPNPADDPGPTPTPDPDPDPEPDDGGANAKQICQANNFKGQSFHVIAASGNTITASESIVNCPSLKGEVRRDARKLREFVGDVTNINGNQITVNPHDLPPSCKAQKGETLKVIWKPRRHKK